MTVYVDEFGKYLSSNLGIFKDGSCHMTADTLEELHEMAHKIGMKREWFQDKNIPHYDLTSKRRSAALASGAVFKPALEQARERLQRRKEDR